MATQAACKLPNACFYKLYETTLLQHLQPRVRSCESYCMEQSSAGRKSYTYMATDLDR